MTKIIRDIIPQTEVAAAHRAYTLRKFTSSELLDELDRRNKADLPETCADDIHNPNENGYCPNCGITATVAR